MLQPEPRADHQPNTGVLRLGVGANDTGERALVGDGESVVAQLGGALGEFFRSGCSSEKG